MSSESETDSKLCPFCKSADACEHLLLVADKTYRELEGGILSDAFASRWEDIASAHIDDPSFNLGDAFGKLLAEVRPLADAVGRYHHDGEFGISSDYEIYYISSLNNANAALNTFNAKSDAK